MKPEELQAIVAERKAEKKRQAEAKRQDGLRRIAEMKSRTGIDPLSHFPEEIWCMIMEDLSAKDKANMSQVHPLFHNLTESHRVRDILLPMALDHGTTFLQGLLPSPGGNFQETLDQLKSLRLVSKATRASVDKWIEEDILQSMRTSSESPRLGLIQLRQIRWVHEASNTLRIMTVYPGAVEQTPEVMFRRSFKLTLMPSVFSCNDEQIVDMFQHLLLIIGERANVDDNIAELLGKVGDQISFFHFELAGPSTEMLQKSLPLVYGVLQEYLALMPNLRWLKVNTLGLDSCLGVDWTEVRSQRQEGMPKLRLLERVDLRACREFRMCDAILEANPHVKYYNHRGMNGNNDERYLWEPAVLALPLETVNVGRGFQWKLRRLERVSDSNWKLKVLELKLDMSTMEMDQVFDCLSEIPTLETLHLNIDKGTVGEEVDYLRQPNLKTLKLDIGSEMRWEGNIPPVFFFSLEVLLRCGKLEELTWNSHAQLAYSEMEEGLIGFRGGVEDLRASNVWDVFPWLRYVKVNVRDGAKYIERVYRNRELVYGVDEEIQFSDDEEGTDSD